MFIRVCGNEQVPLTLDDGNPLTPVPAVSYYYQYRTGTNWVQTSHADIKTWFTEDTYCKFVSYKLLIFSGSSYYPCPYGNIALDTSRALKITTDRNMKETFYASVTTKGKVKQY